tara:strand:+ start:14 stop:1240 length:1227 start_codon:yes stop_codon:yes gene_type:complete
MATPAQRTNTWTLDEWYDQAVAGTQGDYSGEKQLWVWGGSNSGRLGLNNQTNISSPTQLPAGSGNWTNIVAGYSGGTGSNANDNGNLSMFAIKDSTEAWGWGYNEYGNLGQNGRTNYSSPRQIPGSWSKVYMTKWGGAGINTDGELWMWGYNNQGTLGQNEKLSTRTGYSSPVQVPGTWNDLLSNHNINLALKTDGTLWGWGSGGSGGLAQNNRTSYSSPVLIPGTDWSHFPKGVGGWNRIFKTDGSLWGWGSTAYGELGQNTSPAGGTEQFSSPVQIVGTWGNVTGGTAALMPKTNGELWGVGQNNMGQLGLNTTVNYSSPIQIGTDTDWTNNVFSNDVMSGGIKTDGTFWMWGFGDNGSFGLNYRETIGPGIDYVSSPVQLPGSWPGVLGNSIAQGDRVTYYLKNL